MHYCGMSEDYILYRLPLARGLQYIHAALLSQGAHCINRMESKREFDCLLQSHESIVRSYQQNNYDDD